MSWTEYLSSFDKLNDEVCLLITIKILYLYKSHIHICMY